MRVQSTLCSTDFFQAWPLGIRLGRLRMRQCHRRLLSRVHLLGFLFTCSKAIRRVRVERFLRKADDNVVLSPLLRASAASARRRRRRGRVVESIGFAVARRPSGSCPSHPRSLHSVEDACQLVQICKKHNLDPHRHDLASNLLAVKKTVCRRQIAPDHVFWRRNVHRNGCN